MTNQTKPHKYQPSQIKGGPRLCMECNKPMSAHKPQDNQYMHCQNKELYESVNGEGSYPKPHKCPTCGQHKLRYNSDGWWRCDDCNKPQPTERKLNMGERYADIVADRDPPTRRADASRQARDCFEISGYMTTKTKNANEWQFAFAARAGKMQLRKVRYSANGKSEVVALTDWQNPSDAYATMGRLANALFIGIQHISEGIDGTGTHDQIVNLLNGLNLEK